MNLISSACGRFLPIEAHILTPMNPTPDAGKDAKILKSLKSRIRVLVDGGL